MSKKKKSNKSKTRKKNIRRPILITILLLLIVAFIASLVLLFSLEEGTAADIPTQSGTVDNSGEATTPDSSTRPQTTQPTISLENPSSLPIRMDNGLIITDIGKYTGAYMEDGSDEVVSGVLMIVVTNRSETDLQYAEIDLFAGDLQVGRFSLSTLKAGASIVLLDLDRTAYDKSLAYDKATVRNVAVFSQPMSKQEDILKLQTIDGVINVTNISGEDITGDIVIYYKNSSADLYYGGVTYRARITGGLKAGELRQLLPSHFNDSNCEILFVTVG